MRNSSVGITTATTTLVKTGSGDLKRIVINKPVAAAVITIYDALTATSRKIATITLPATLLQDVYVIEYDVLFSTGLCIVTSQATDITVVYN